MRSRSTFSYFGIAIALALCSLRVPIRFLCEHWHKRFSCQAIGQAVWPITEVAKAFGKYLSPAGAGIIARPRKGLRWAEQEAVSAVALI